jgi:hypothetical protein
MKRCLAFLALFAGLAFHSGAEADGPIAIDGNFVCGYGYIERLATGWTQWGGDIIGYWSAWHATQLAKMPNLESYPGRFQTFGDYPVFTFSERSFSGEGFLKDAYVDRRALLETAYFYQLPVQISTLPLWDDCQDVDEEEAEVKICASSYDCYSRLERAAATSATR